MQTARVRCGRALEPDPALHLPAHRHLQHRQTPGRGRPPVHHLHLLGPVRLAWCNDTRDDPLDPRRGHFLCADLQLSHARAGRRQLREGLRAGRRLPAASRRARCWRVSGRVGLARTFGLEESLLPAASRPLLRRRRLQPARLRASDAVNPLGGNALLLGSAELRVDIGAPFAAGRLRRRRQRLPAGVATWTSATCATPPAWACATARAFGPLRIDWGYKLDRAAGRESRRALHVTIGHAF